MNYFEPDVSRPLQPSYEQEAELIAAREMQILQEREARFDLHDRNRMQFDKNMTASERAEIARRIAWRQNPATTAGQKQRCLESARASLFRNY